MQSLCEHEALDALVTRIENIGGHIKFACSGLRDRDTELKRVSSLADCIKGMMDRLAISATAYNDQLKQHNKERSAELDGILVEAMQATAFFDHALSELSEAGAAF